LSARQPDSDSLRSLIVRYDLRYVDVARHASRTAWALSNALDRDQLRGLGPKTRQRYVRAIEKARRDVLRRVEVAS